MKILPSNLLTAFPENIPDEIYESIFKKDGIHIERIVSKGHITAIGQWYDQDWDEWVLLLQGQATISFLPNEHRIHLKTGDYLLIPAHTQHRVDWTPSDKITIWLAIHFK